MAVIEIAKIQVRRGDVRSIGMPQLDTGEFGWAITGTDPNSTKPELFIGNKVSDGATVNTNTRILTVLDLASIQTASVSTSTFIYSGNQLKPGGTGAHIYTGDTNSDITRTVEEKLNDYVCVTDFGVIHDDDSNTTTVGLQRALDQLFLNTDKNSPRARVALRIPAGVYNISDTIYIPPYTTLIGDGQEKTVLNFVGTNKALFQFIDGSSTTGSRVQLANFNSNTSPRNILIKGMTLRFSDAQDVDAAYPLLYADASLDSIIEDVRFQGYILTPYSQTNIDQCGISIRGTGAITSKNLRIVNCRFDNLHYGIRSSYDIEDTIIERNRFENLYRGIVLGESRASGQQTGPKTSSIARNVFYLIAQEGILVSASGTTSTIYNNNISSQNTFNNVGNNSSRQSPGQGDVGGQSSSVISFETFGNVSDNDYFSRFVAINNTSTSANFIIPVAGHASVIDHRVRSTTLAATSSTGIFAKFAHSGAITNLRIQYHLTLNSPSVSRWGELFVVTTQGQVVDITDNYKNYGANDGNVSFNASYSVLTNTISVTYSGNSYDGQITYQINQYY